VRLGRHDPEGKITCDSMGAILAISYALAGSFKLEDVLDRALNLVGDVVNAEGSSILLIDPDTQGMKFYVAAGPAADKAKSVPLPPGTGICGHVAQTGKSLVVNDAQNDPRFFGGVDQATSMTTRNILCVPINSHARMWGVLELINKIDADGFHFEDLRLAEVVATQVGLALENAHLHNQTVHTEKAAAVGQTVGELAGRVEDIITKIQSASANMEQYLNAGDMQQIQQGWETIGRHHEMLSELLEDMSALTGREKAQQ